MSNPTLLVLAPLTPEQAARWKPRFDALVGEVAAADAVTAGLQLWASSAESFLSDIVQGVFWHAMAEWDFLADLTQEFAAASDAVEILVSRKLAPMAVLMTGLGWERARGLPGIAGLWLVDPHGARASAGNVEDAFTLTTSERGEVLRRMAQALALGDADIDLDGLLDMVPRTFTAAVAQGHGLVCCSGVVQ